MIKALRVGLVVLVACLFVACGSSTATLPERVTMSPPDIDGDGVPDRSDRCPGTLMNIPVDARGCPFDEDQDGVFDYLDRCPGTVLPAVIDEFGCAVQVAAETEGEVDLVLATDRFTFELNSYVLDAAAKAAIDAALPKILGQPDRILEIVGHTDNTGATAYNQRLSERRAQAVVDYLLNRGVEPEQLSASGRGEMEPIATNDTYAGQAANRRVQLTLR